SVNNPETSSYHLHVFSLYQHHSQPITQLINPYQLNPKHLQPNKPTIPYLKQPQKISHFLTFIPPYQPLFKFQHLPILPHITNSLNPFLNSHTPNLNKTLTPPIKHLQTIHLIHKQIPLHNLP
ncbi:DNA-binding protein WhiA, partial [Staphylococcus saprophyticus]|uniref:DNA-binding protein WhiA n=1 Tax=Staphylococcus saprophyticus TaxID=29385 RepID=UPI0011A3DB33